MVGVIGARQGYKKHKKDLYKPATEERAAIRIQSAWNQQKLRRISTESQKIPKAHTPSWQRSLIYRVLEDPSTSFVAAVVHVGVVATILLSIVAFVVETVPEYWGFFNPGFWFALEIFCTFVFTVEYALRLWSCTVATSRWNYFWSPLTIMDLISILPFYIDLSIYLSHNGNSSHSQILRGLRVFRLVRLVRLFKLGRHSEGLRLMFNAVSNSYHVLVVLGNFYVISWLLFSALLFYFEKWSCTSEEQAAKLPADERRLLELHARERWCENTPRVGWRSPHNLCCDIYGAPLDFGSVMQAGWWCVATMTTVGYGDRLPRTTQGRIVAALVLVMGALVIALPVAIVGRKFQDVYNKHVALEQKFRHLKKVDNTSVSRCAIMNPQPGRKAEPNDPMSRLRRMRVVDDRCRNTQRKLCSHLSGYQKILEDSLRVHKDICRRNEELSRLIETTFTGH